MSALAAIHVARKQLGLDEDTYRAVLVRVTGKASAAAMSEAERQSVVQELRRHGFKPARKGLEGPYAKKLQALWIAGWNLGLVRDRSDAAMLAFVARQTGIEHTRFLRDAADARKAVEALKGWIARDGGVDWKESKYRQAWMETPGFRIAWAQYRILVPGATIIGNGRAFRREIERILGTREFDLGQLPQEQWQAVMNGLGERVRKAAG